MKRKLPNLRSIIITLVISNLFLLSVSAGFAATKTWNGGTGGSRNWNVAGNWLPSGIPVAGDDIVFNTAGTITFTAMPGNIAYGSLTISQGVVTFADAGTPSTLTIGSVVPDPDFFISGGGASLTLGTNVTLTLAASATANISGDLIVNTGRTFNTNGANVSTSVFGTINNLGTVNGTLTTLTFGGGSAYVHSQDAGTIPTASWNVNSFCNINGLIANHPSGGNQTFGNLTYNSPGMTSNVTMTNGVSVANDFAVLNTGSARLLMTAGSFTVGRDLNIEAGFTVSNTTDRTLTVVRDAFISGGGNLNLCSGASGNIGTLIVGGNFTSFGGITTTATGTGKGVINFNGSAVQNFNQSGGLGGTLDYVINNTGGSTGVTFSNSVAITGSLTLTNGRLTIPTGVTISITNGNVVGGSGFGAAKHIATLVNTGSGAKGFFQVNNIAAATPYLIPVGNGSSYLPVTLTPSNVNSYDICVFNGITTNGEPNGTPFSAGQKANVVDAVYTVNLIGGTAGAGVAMTVGWPASLEGGTFSTYTTLQIGIAHWDNPNWGNCVGSGDNAANTATRTGITVFSPFAVGKTPYVLPIKFSYLNAAKGNGYNSLHWKAACNSSEVTFSIERSTDGINFSPISSITASQARCAQPFDYTDNNSLPGTVFYRIKATEITGQVSYSIIVNLTDQKNDMLLTAVLPNPVISQAQLSITTPKKELVNLVIISMEGKIVQRSSAQLQAGISIISLDVSALQKGMYMIKGTFGNGETNTVRFAKQ
ncbi:MAG TPA: T9SS type A sorting domain-containing protein [Ferruginibacter sp.]|nr:T9SS type A sorting domain-containing protein [Ferruginibacter sp.]